jgi:glycosyltransferase involved in cell wall biosynthesis
VSTHKPRVGIGLPVFNAEKYLEQALNSILAQSFPGFDLIISDNASTDRTQEICQTYSAQDKRIHYFRNENNLGAAPNFNRVFQLSAHEYFKWAPYDDLIEPEFLARCVGVLDRDPKVVLCYSRAKIVNEQGVYVVDYDPGPDTGSQKPHDRFRNLLLFPEYALQQMGLIRSEVLRKTRLHRSFPSSDEVLLAELALRGSFYEIPDRLYIFRRHDQQSTQQPKQRERVRFFDTKLAGKITLPKWSYFLSSIDVINRTPLSFSGRVHCYATILRWLLVPAHFRAMGKDLLVAAGHLMSRAGRSTKTSTSSA